MNYSLVLLLLVFTISACSSNQKKETEIKTTSEIISLGDSEISLEKHLPLTNESVLYLNVHENEATSVQALKKFSLTTPINFAYLRHTGERRLKFNIDTIEYSVDPNRIFTSTGRYLTITPADSIIADSIVKPFAKELLNSLGEIDFLVTLHNNTPDEYSILSYLPDGDEGENTGQVYINIEADPDDFVYTTNEGIYNKLVDAKVNVILQSKTPVNDGSLSVYCGQQNIDYINIETEHGHLDEQLRLLELIHKIINN